MSNDITAPGRSALWTRAALAAIQGLAAASREHGDRDNVADRAMGIADDFERLCDKRYASEQAKVREQNALKLAEAEEEIRRVGRYDVPVRHNPLTNTWDRIVVYVDNVKVGLVTFKPHPEWNHGQPKCVSVWDVLDEEEDYRPMPLTDADLPAVAPDALPTVPGMAESDALLRAEMAERGKTAG